MASWKLTFLMQVVLCQVLFTYGARPWSGLNNNWRRRQASSNPILDRTSSLLKDRTPILKNDNFKSGADLIRSSPLLDRTPLVRNKNREGLLGPLLKGGPLTKNKNVEKKKEEEKKEEGLPNPVVEETTPEIQIEDIIEKSSFEPVIVPVVKAKNKYSKFGAGFLSPLFKNNPLLKNLNMKIGEGLLAALADGNSLLMKKGPMSREELRSLFDKSPEIQNMFEGPLAPLAEAIGRTIIFLLQELLNARQSDIASS